MNIFLNNKEIFSVWDAENVKLQKENLQSQTLGQVHFVTSDN